MAGEMYTSFNKRSELERFRDRFTEKELDEMVERYRDLWEPAFEENMGREAPLHPWKILKQVRERYAENENGGDWPGMPKRHSLRVVKDEYKEEWERLAFGDQ